MTCRSKYQKAKISHLSYSFSSISLNCVVNFINTDFAVRMFYLKKPSYPSFKVTHLSWNAKVWVTFYQTLYNGSEVLGITTSRLLPLFLQFKRKSLPVSLCDPLSFPNWNSFRYFKRDLKVQKYRNSSFDRYIWMFSTNSLHFHKKILKCPWCFTKPWLLMPL